MQKNYNMVWMTTKNTFILCVSSIGGGGGRERSLPVWCIRLQEAYPGINLLCIICYITHPHPPQRGQASHFGGSQLFFCRLENNGGGDVGNHYTMAIQNIRIILPFLIKLFFKQLHSIIRFFLICPWLGVRRGAPPPLICSLYYQGANTPLAAIHSHNYP